MATKVDKCGFCKKAVVSSDNGVVCEVCEGWFHSKCQSMSDDTYKLLNPDKIHFFCGNCDKAVGKILKSLSELALRQDRLDQRMNMMKKDISMELRKLNEDLGGVKRKFDKENWQENMIKMRSEINEDLKKV